MNLRCSSVRFFDLGCLVQWLLLGRKQAASLARFAIRPINLQTTIVCTSFGSRAIIHQTCHQPLIKVLVGPRMCSTSVCRKLLSLSTLRKSPGTDLASILRTPFSKTARRTMATAMAKRLEGKTIIVTGASSGIGKSTGSSTATVSFVPYADAVQQWSSLGRLRKASS